MNYKTPLTYDECAKIADTLANYIYDEFRISIDNVEVSRTISLISFTTINIFDLKKLNILSHFLKTSKIFVDCKMVECHWAAPSPEVLITIRGYVIEGTASFERELR